MYKYYITDKQFAMKLATTEYIIVCGDESTSFFLWMKYSEESKWYDANNKQSKLSWKQDNSGFWSQIGAIQKRPVCVNCSWSNINKHRVMFVYMCSELCDYEMLDRWLKLVCPNANRILDAMNFPFEELKN